MTQEEKQPQEEQAKEILIGEGLSKEISKENIYAPESLDEKMDLSEKTASEIADAAKSEADSKRPKQVNFKAKGVIDYEIEYEGDDLKITSANSDEAAMIYLFQTRMRIEAARANMYKKEYKNQYTSIDRQDINASLRVLNKLVQSIGQRVYQNARINNMTPAEREAYREANAKATAEWEIKLKDFEEARKLFDSANNDLKTMKNGPERLQRYHVVRDLEKIMKQKHKALFV